ncbi:MAG: hypothetical protein OXN83_01940 [Oligoflexia bacterium]|nr:hypothetical protein [Oligoflexia bacterium]
MSSEDKRFLIRSSGHILGPFFKDEVIELIKRGKISVFDEVTEPYTIWLYLQDHADFKQTVHSISMQTRLVNFLSSVSTKISQVSKKTEGQTIDRTVTETSTKEQSFNPIEKQSAKEVSVSAVKPIQTSSSTESGYTSEEESQEIIRKKIAVFVSISWKTIILGVLLVGSYIFYKEFYKPLQKKQTVRKGLESQGIKFYQVGNIKKALPFFERAYSDNLLNDDEKILLASLLIQENKIPKAVVIKNEILNSPSFKKTNGILLNSLLSYYQEDDTQFKNQLKHLIKTNPDEKSTDIALFNLALYNWENNNYKKSIGYLDNQLLTRGFERDIVFYLKALNLLFQKKLDELESYLMDKTFMKEFKQELYLLSAYIHMKKQNKQELDSYITKLLNEDPFLYKEYSYSPFIIKNNLFSWRYLHGYCREIFNFAPNENLFKALYGFCYSKANDYKFASYYINQVKSKESKNPLFLSLYSYLIMAENGDTVKLDQIFSLINYHTTILPLPFILKARFLENQEEWETALNTWKQLLLINPYHLSGMAGVAFTSYQLGDESTGAIYTNRTLENYPHYMKLLSYKK